MSLMMGRAKLWRMYGTRMDPAMWMEGTQGVIVENGDGLESCSERLRPAP